MDYTLKGVSWTSRSSIKIYVFIWILFCPRDLLFEIKPMSTDEFSRTKILSWILPRHEPCASTPTHLCSRGTLKMDSEMTLNTMIWLKGKKTNCRTPMMPNLLNKSHGGDRGAPQRYSVSYFLSRLFILLKIWFFLPQIKKRKAS